MTPIPTWLRAHLEATGQLNADGISRTVHTHTCRCGRTVLRGLDGPVAALTAVVDPQPISALGEATALIAGAWTYDLIPARGRQLELHHRNLWNIAGQRRWPVHATHMCGITWPADTDPPPLIGFTTQPNSIEVPF
jgi:hypothetical protein